MGGRQKHTLERVLETYPVVMHGVSLSIGTVDTLNSDYLAGLKRLADWVKPAWVSDHLCWTGIAHQNSHDLLPVPYTEDTLKHIIERIKQVQDYLGRPLVLENPSTYLEFKASQMPEEEFIARMAIESGCGLLLDANNIYVTCYNHRKDPKVYIDALPLDHVYQIHLAGHTNKGTHIVDTHNAPVIDPVWQLYKYIIHKGGLKNTMIEWDDDIPAFDVVNDELLKARQAAASCESHDVLPQLLQNTVLEADTICVTSLEFLQKNMLDSIVPPYAVQTKPSDWIKPKPDFPEDKQLDVYINGYRQRLFEVTSKEFPALRHYLGDSKMDTVLKNIVGATPSRFYDAGKYPSLLPDFFANHPLYDVFAGELCALESAVSQLYTAPESQPLEAKHIQMMGEDGVMECLIPLRTALQLLAFTQNVNAYYSAFVKGEGDLVAPLETASYLVVFRHEDTLWRLPLELEEYEILSLMGKGHSIADAVEARITDSPEAESIIAVRLGLWFAQWIKNGLLSCNLETGNTVSTHENVTNERLAI